MEQLPELTALTYDEMIATNGGDDTAPPIPIGIKDWWSRVVDAIGAVVGVTEMGGGIGFLP